MRTAKKIISAIAILLVMVILTGVCVQVFAPDGKKVTDWFKKNECVHIDEDNDGICDECKKEMPAGDEKQDETPAYENGGAIVNESATVSKGIKLMSARIASTSYDEYGISPQADSAYTLTATITPSNATNKTVDWSVSWANASASWVNGKTVTDYVTVTPTSDGSLTANVTCIKAFGEKINVSCVSRQSSDITATCTLDYAKRLSSIDVQWGKSLHYLCINNSSFSNTSTIADLKVDSTQFFPQFATGTFDDTFIYSYTISYSADWINALKAQGFTPEKSANIDYEFKTAYMGILFGMGALNANDRGDVECYCVGVDANGAYTKFSAAARSMNGKVFFTIKATATGTYSTFVGTCQCSSPASVFAIPVKSVSLTSSSYVF